MKMPTLSRHFGALSCVLGLSSLGACQTLDDFGAKLNELNDGMGEYAEKTVNTGPELAPATLPDFGIGDAFVFDSGRAIYVEKISGDNFVWNGGGDYRFETSADFTGPNLEWSYTDKEDRKRSGTTTIKEGSVTNDDVFLFSRATCEAYTMQRSIEPEGLHFSQEFITAVEELPTSQQSRCLASADECCECALQCGLQSRGSARGRICGSDGPIEAKRDAV